MKLELMTRRTNKLLAEDTARIYSVGLERVSIETKCPLNDRNSYRISLSKSELMAMLKEIEKWEEQLKTLGAK